MNNVLIWLPKHIQEGQKNLDEFIGFARDELGFPQFHGH